jgi:phytoene desaturase
MNKKVIIIGAGPGGLANAMLLAANGFDVTVVERAGKVGGRTTSIEGDGFKLDVGPTFFLYPRVLEEIFSAVGRDLHKEVKLVRLDPQYRIIFGQGGELLATGDIARMEKQIAAISPEDAPAFRRFMDDNRIKLERFRPCLESPFLSWRDVATVRLMKLLPLLRPHRSLDSELGRYFKEPRIRLAFSFQSKYLGMSPFRCPSLFSILSFIEYEHGVFHPIGGCGAISEAMAKVAGELGVKILLKHDVTEVLFEGRRAVGVRANGQEMRGDAVVINADFARAMHRLVPSGLRKRWSDSNIAKKKFSCSTFMMYLGLEGRQDHLPHHNIFISRDYLRNMADIEQRHVLSEEPSFYVANPSVTDSTMAPPGMSALYVLVPVSHMHPNIDWQRRKDPFRAATLRQLKQIGLEDVEKRIRFERICTPADWQNHFEIHRGATFNLSHNLRQMLHLRPHNRFEELDNVYLVGGGTHPGSGLPVIFESARITARLVQEDLAV